MRFVARLKPNLSETDAEDVMRRLSASLNQQTAAIRNIEHPAGKKFPKLRGGTEESTLKFMMKLYHMVGGGTNTKALDSMQGRYINSSSIQNVRMFNQKVISRWNSKNLT